MIQLTDHTAPCGCRSRFSWDDSVEFVQTFVAFKACPTHPDRSGRIGYITTQAECFAPSLEPPYRPSFIDPQDVDAFSTAVSAVLNG